MALELGSFGIWRQWHRLSPGMVGELEALGYGAVWLGSSPGGDLRMVEELLAATDRITVATSIVNMWKDDASSVAASYHRIAQRYGDRFLLGVRIGHPEQNASYTSPYRTIAGYLDELDAAGVPAGRRALAALGPRVLRLAAERCAGALPYLVTPAHTRRSRDLLGPDRLLVPEQKVVVEVDPQRARAIGRPPVRNQYLGLTNYTRNLRTLGYTEEDLSGKGSDRLIDDLVVHGSPAAVASGLGAHLDAGADHVALQLLTEDGADPLPGYRALAAALGLGPG